MTRDRLQAVAEHESAHAIVAAALGLYVARSLIRPDGTGATLVGHSTPDVDAAISAAGDTWDREYADRDYVDLACIDLVDQLSRVGTSGIWLARRAAREVLEDRRREVLRLADRLYRERVINFAAA